jgi:[ribosomal protein S5]-alanine N-acetyltransferase
MVILETDRLLFRHMVPSDLDDLFQLYSDPEIRRYFPDGTRNLEETKEELEWFLNGHPRHPELGLWATIHKETGRFVGRCGLLPWTIEGQDEVEIAYMIAKPFWRQGLGAEAAMALVEYGFDNLGLQSLIALIDPDHEASLKTAIRAGLKFDFQTTMDGLPTVVYRIKNPKV